MRVGIMQPYFLPYIGYFQLIAAVDQFVVYDNIKYTKKGWINRNRLLQNGKDVMFSLPLKKDSDSLDVVDRELAADFNRDKLLNQFRGAYSRAPYFTQTYLLLEKIVANSEANLFKFIYGSIVELCKYLDIKTQILISSTISIDHALKNQHKVIALCEALGADTYINTMGGFELYDKDEFHTRGIELKFIQPKPFEYAQFNHDFVPWLSIMDVLMFNELESVRERILPNYELI
ncbi:MAG TPA: WbqC family protein [Gammaproteobacteria bacterium]|nr:WbqC family protein [Gammaproteobacteria bacterium]